MVSLNLGSLTDVPNLKGLDRAEVKQAIKQWFYANFEDPAENTPYESAEGGYQYIWGGPYDARDEVGDAFYDAPQETLPQDLVEEIITELDYESAEWAPNSNRIYDEDPPDHEPEPPYREIQWHLDQVQRLMLKIEPASSLIGSNKPPEEIGVPPYSDEDKKEIESAIETLRLSENELLERPNETIEAARTLKVKGERLKEFFARHGDKFIDSFAAQLGKRAADSITITLWIALSTSLMAAAAAVEKFLEGYIHLPF